MKYAHAYMLGSLDGISEWKGWPYLIDQATVDTRWREIGQDAPAPLVPQTLLGKKILASKGGRRVGEANGKLRKSPSAGAFTKAENDFLNFWNKVAVDPYRKQSLTSKVAGGVLQVASVVIPNFGYFQAVAAAGNAALALDDAKSDALLSARVMASATQAQATSDAADFAGQIEKLKSLAPPAPSVARRAQDSFAAASAPVTRKASTPDYMWPLVAGFSVAAVLLMVRR